VAGRIKANNIMTSENMCATWRW